MKKLIDALLGKFKSDLFDMTEETERLNKMLLDNVGYLKEHLDDMLKQNDIKQFAQSAAVICEYTTTLMGLMLFIHNEDSDGPMFKSFKVFTEDKIKQFKEEEK